jgi:copper chaperone
MVAVTDPRPSGPDETIIYDYGGAHMTQRKLLIGVAAVAVFLSAVFFISAKSTTTDRSNQPTVVEVTADTPKTQAPAPALRPIATDARAVLVVEGMSCSGCINTIKSGLSGVDGVGDVLVDLSAGRVEVNYDSSALKDTGKIASAITATGYPATLQRILSKEEIEKQESFFAVRSKRYIAAVGEWEIAREDYNTELAHARKRYESIYGPKVFDGDQGAALLQRIKSQIASRLIDEGIQMQEILKAGYQLPPEMVDREFDRFLTRKGVSRQQFERMLAGSGYRTDYFMKKFKYRITVDRYVEEKVLNGLMSDREKQQRYSEWFNNARLLAQVTYYDRELAALLPSSSASSGCGSSCSRQPSG